jgi:hypothetical protein
MIGYILSAVLLAAALAMGTATAVAASEPIRVEHQTFGQHVAGMAPEHPQMHGALFGACVSTMAQGGDCPHHP